MRQVHGPRPRLARGERRPELCRSVAGDGVEPQRQQPREQRGVVDGAGTDAEPGRSQGADERGREEEVLNADAVQPRCLRPAGERVDAVVGDDDQACPEAPVGG